MRESTRPLTDPYHRLADHSAEAFQRWAAGTLPDHLGIEVLSIEPRRLRCRVRVRREIMAPHGYLHGGVLAAVGDTLCGYGCIVNLPAGASGFVTVELKTNFLGTLREGAMVCEATPVHVGRTTQVWDARLSAEGSDRVLAIFRCTQLVLLGPTRENVHEESNARSSDG